MESIKNNIPTPETKISQEAFDEQFIEKKIDIGGQDFVYVKVEPSEAISPEYVLFLGGFGAGAEEYRHEIKDLVESGRKVLFTNPLQGIVPEAEDSKVMDLWNVPVTIQCKVAEVLALLDHAGITRADFVCHSQGAAVGSIVAMLRSGLAEDLVLANPAGMHGEDTRMSLIGRTAIGFGEQQITNIQRATQGVDERSRVAATLGSVIKGTKMQQKPLWRFQEEIPGIIESNIIPMLQNLKSTQSSLEESRKTKVTLVTANRDRTFSPDKIEENLKNAANEPDTPEAFFGDAIDSYVMFSKPEAGHEAIIYENPGLSAQIVNEKFQSKPDTGEVK